MPLRWESSSSRSKLSYSIIPFARIPFPTCKKARASGRSSSSTKILEAMESVSSVKRKLSMVFPLFVLRSSTVKMRPQSTTIPLSSRSSDIGVGCSEKSLP